ncbi:MAG: restriction endonuclease subunit S [Desulforhopalus sp.]
MNVQEFLGNFGYFSNAPDGVMRLREMILHCAVSGLLVTQNDTGGNAEQDIEQAENLRKDFHQLYQIRNRKLVGPLRDDEIPFTIPSNWKWARMESVACYIQRGKGPKYDEKGRARVVSQKCIQWSGFDLTPARRISDKSLEKYGKERILTKNDLLWNSTGTGTAGRISLYPGSQETVVADSHVTVIRMTNFIPQYIWCYLASPTIQMKMVPNQEGSMVSGTTNQVELSTNKVFELPVPCPPIEEQKRIVAKVDELMALCDKLERQQQEREQLFPVLSNALHIRLAELTTPANLKAIFDKINTVSPEDVRKTIISLAVQGKLVFQDTGDGTAHDLIGQVYNLREELLRKKLIRKPKNLLPLDVSKCEFLVPPSWTWVRLGDVTIDFRYGTSKRCVYEPIKIPVLRIPNLQSGRIDPRDMKYTSMSSKEFEALKLRDGDLLIIRSNGSESLVGRSAVITQAENEFAYAGYLVRARIPQVEGLVHTPYIHLAMETTYVRKQIEEPIRTTSGVKNINTNELAHLRFPLPPFREQKRIVSKVNQLMTLVNLLEEQQNKKSKTAEAFAQAAVATITGIEIKEQEKMKAPKTELVTKLQLESKPKPNDKSPLANILAKNEGELSAKALWRQSGLEIDVFYQQLKTEMGNGWVAEPEKAIMKEMEAN